MEQNYNVIIDFECNLYDNELIDVFSDAIHVEAIGTNQYQVGYSVFAHSKNEAYRRGMNLVTAKLETLDSGLLNWIDAKVYEE